MSVCLVMVQRLDHGLWPFYWPPLMKCCQVLLWCTVRGMKSYLSLQVCVVKWDKNVHNACLQSDVGCCSAALCRWFMRASQWLSLLQKGLLFPPSLMVHSSSPITPSFCSVLLCNMLDKRDPVWLIYEITHAPVHTVLPMTVAQSFDCGINMYC